MLLLASLGACNSSPSSVGLQNRIEARRRVEGHKSRLELEQAHSAFATGQFKKAMKIAQKAQQRVPDSPEPYMLMARICLETAQLEAADQMLSEALAIEPQIPDAHFLKGIVYQRWSRDEQALDAYLAAWNLDPNSVHSVHYLLAAGEMLMDMGHYTEARELLLPKLAFFENSAAMHHLLGTIAVLLDEYDIAIDHLKQSMLIGGHDEYVMSDLARAQLGADEYHACLRTLVKIEAGMKDSIPTWVHRLRARCYHEMGSPNDARSAYAELLRVDPKDIIAWIEYGATAHELGDMQRLSTCADRLMSLAPGRSEGYLYKGYVHIDAGRMATAATWLSKAVNFAAPGETVPQLTLAHVELIRGENARALQLCNVVLSSNPSDRDAQSCAAACKASMLASVGETAID